MSKAVVGPYSVQSSNFSYHTPVSAESYPQALVTAKKRGFEAHIYAYVKAEPVLVATWSPLYGTKIYNHDLTAPVSA